MIFCDNALDMLGEQGRSGRRPALLEHHFLPVNHPPQKIEFHTKIPSVCWKMHALCSYIFYRQVVQQVLKYIEIALNENQRIV